MKEVEITCDVYCRWTASPPAYRVYVDNDLLTERTYVWDISEQFVRENIIVNIEPGAHSLRIEPVNPEVTSFSIRNITINKQPVTLVNNQFIIQ